VHAGGPEPGHNLHHDRIVEKLEIARTLGLVTDFRVGPAEAPGTARVTVRPGAATEAHVKDYLTQLLGGMVAAPDIMVTDALDEGRREPVRKLTQYSERIGLIRSMFRARTVHLYRLAAAGAMLTCAAVVLGLCSVAKAPVVTSAVFQSDEPTLSLIVADANGSRVVAQPHVADWPAPTMNVVDRAEALPEAIHALLQVPFAVADSAPAPVDPGTALARTDDAAAVVGVWAPDAGTCSARDFQEGLLPTVINSDGAWAGETFCLFTKRKETDNGWTVVAKCATPRERWTSNVRLSVSDNRLIWASKRGTQVYTRCRPDVLMAQAR